MEEYCKICGELLENSHPYKKHSIKLSDYYSKYFPKNDLLTNEVLPFRNRDSYLLTDFSSKINLKQWLKLQPVEKQKEYLKDILLRRKEFKGLIYTPTQVELRSYEACPGIVKFNELFGDYYQLCNELGFKSRGFQNIDKKTIIKKERELKNNSILIDSREQDYLKFKNIEISTLPVGDYTCKNNNYNIYIERKSLADLVSTFGPKNFERFKRELIKVQEMGGYLILLVEKDINAVLGFDRSPFHSKHTQMTSVYLFHQIRILLQELDCWQIAFCKSRTDMTEKIKFIFEMGETAKFMDWQLAFDLKIVNNNI